MPSPGKPVSNPFASSFSKKVLDKQGATHLLPPALRSIRGISRLGTENRLSALPMPRAAVLSVGLHVFGPIALTALTLLALLILSWVMHFNFWDLFRPHTPPADLEFTLVRDTQATRPEKPVFKGNFNQRAGGKNNPKQRLKAVEHEANATPAKKASPPAVTPPEEVKPPTETPKAEQPLTPEEIKPPEKNLTTAENPPEPTIAFPSKEKTTEASSEAVAQNASADTSAAGGDPQTIAFGDSWAGVGASAGSLSNPQGGDGPPGVDVAQDADFGPFMAELERRIKRNWTPPRGSESRKVQLLFYLGRDGRLLKVETKKSSGDTNADQAAVAAVVASSPFLNFPPEVKEDVLPVEFTFDYNVLNPKNAKQALKW